MGSEDAEAGWGWCGTWQGEEWGVREGQGEGCGEASREGTDATSAGAACATFE